MIFKIIKISLWSTGMQMHLGQGRSSHRSCFIKVGVLENFVIFTGNHLCGSLFLIKLQFWRLTTLLIPVFSYEYCEILKQLFWRSLCVRLLLTRHKNSICFLFLKKFPSLRFLSIFSESFWWSIKKLSLIFSLRLCFTNITNILF